MEQNKQRKWCDKPYNFFGDYLREKYNCRILKLTINANLGCPNRDGTISRDGCIFCSENGSASPTTCGTDDIKEQMEQARIAFRRSDVETKFISYFQAYSNTHAPVEKLKLLYDDAISFPDVIGLMIGTRPDSLDEAKLDLIASYNKPDFELWLELGMQSIHDKSLSYLHRGHDYAITRKMILAAAERKIPVCVHVILGIPGEDWHDMMETAKELSSLPISGVKIHHLHVIKNTPLATEYEAGKFRSLEFNEYISLITDFIERLRPDITIHRLAGDKALSELVAPLWSVEKGTLVKAINDEFAHRVSWQGLLV